VATIEDLRDEITREERLTNLRADGTVTVEEINRRRRQMFLLGVVVLVGLLFTTVANDVWTSFRDTSWIDPEVARIALIAFGVCSVGYLYDKEQHLKRLTRLGRDVQDLDAALAATMLRSAFVADATVAVHGSLDLDEVLQRVANESSSLVGAGSVTLRLVDDDGDLSPVATQIDVASRAPAEPAEPAEDMLKVVARTREPALLNSGTVSVLCVPLLHEQKLLALLILSGTAAHRFNDDDSALIGRFAAPAASAIFNAQRYEAALFLLDRDLDELPELPVG
jgi:hypothetical protein